MELIVDRLTKKYENKIAVDRVSYKMTKGIYGLLGANGAGKTTLMRMLCGILKPTGGEVKFNGIDVSREEYREALGYLPPGIWVLSRIYWYGIFELHGYA